MCDGCPATVRYKHAAAQYCLECERLFYNESDTCAAHTLHNICKKCCNEGGVVGHAHALAYVFSLDSRRKQLLGALRHLVNAELVVYDGAPPAEHVAHAEACVAETVLRVRNVGRAKAGSGFEDDFDMDKELVHRTRPLLAIANGDIVVPVVSHLCQG